VSGGASAGATPAPGTGPHRRRAAGAGPAQIPLPRRVRHFLLIAGAALLALVAWSAPAAPAMAVGGFALALVLSFPVGLLGRYLPRTLAIAASFLLLAALLALAVSSAIPLLSDQLSALFASAPRLVGEA
jgi:predicted PurR-regulated permease PerM